MKKLNKDGGVNKNIFTLLEFFFFTAFEQGTLAPSGPAQLPTLEDAGRRSKKVKQNNKCHKI